jgi:hypothetical protein
MKEQKQKLKKVKRIMTKDTCSSSHAPPQRTRFLGIASQLALVPEANTIHSHVVSSQCSERVCRKIQQMNSVFMNDVHNNFISVMFLMSHFKVALFLLLIF